MFFGWRSRLLYGLAANALVALGCVTAKPSPSTPEGTSERAWVASADLAARVPERAVLGPLKSNPQSVAVVGATVLIGNGARLTPGTLVIEQGRISAVGPAAEVPVPNGARVIEAADRYVTPGLIDTHSHIGVYAVPEVESHADGNEMTDPTTPYVFAEHAFWPHDPAIDEALAGGVTTIQVLPGSGNVIGGRAVVLKLRPRREARAMRFPDAPFGLKIACGENPKRVYGSKGQRPMSRMGSVFELRNAFLEAQSYAKARARFERAHAEWKKRQGRNGARPTQEPESPPRDLGLETLADALEGRVRVHIHCYRADEMLLMLSLADELGFLITSFHHATEAYKIADVLAQRGVYPSIWADWWGFKMEAYDSVEANAAILEVAGARPVIHSDSPIGIQRLNQEAAKALYAGLRLGLRVDSDRALTWITQNPAEALGIAEQVGTLEVGKMGDVVVWDRDPMSVYARANVVLVDGAVVYDRSEPQPSSSDFDVGSAVEVLP